MNEETYTVPAPKFEIGQTVQRYDGKKFKIQNRVYSEFMQQWYYTEEGKPFSKFDHRERDVMQVVPEMTKAEKTAAKLQELFRLGGYEGATYVYQPEKNRVIFSLSRLGEIYLTKDFAMNTGNFSLSKQTLEKHIKIMEALNEN